MSFFIAPRISGVAASRWVDSTTSLNGCTDGYVNIEIKKEQAKMNNDNKLNNIAAHKHHGQSSAVCLRLCVDAVASVRSICFMGCRTILIQLRCLAPTVYVDVEDLSQCLLSDSGDP